MAKVVISYPGDQVVREITALVPRPASPSVAQAPHIGLVEISQPAEMIPGPPGPPGPSVTDGAKGDVVVSDSGATWTLDPDRVKGTVRLTVSATAPTSPAVNDVWIDIS